MTVSQKSKKGGKHKTVTLRQRTTMSEQRTVPMERPSDVAARERMVALVAATLLLDAPGELALAAVTDYERYVAERRRRRIERPLIPAYAFDLAVYERDAERSYRELRFSIPELRQIIDALRWEATITTRKRHRVRHPDHGYAMLTIDDVVRFRPLKRSSLRCAGWRTPTASTIWSGISTDRRARCPTSSPW
jgi:hypothetical protein